MRKAIKQNHTADPISQKLPSMAIQGMQDSRSGIRSESFKADGAGGVHRSTLEEGPDASSSSPGSVGKTAGSCGSGTLPVISPARVDSGGAAANSGDATREGAQPS
jgi:hypothetical protein